MCLRLLQITGLDAGNDEREQAVEIRRFEFEALVGSTKIGATLAACGGQAFPFIETKPVRLLILPVERGRKDPIFNGTDHVKNFYLQLDTIARAYPVRDGVGIFGVPDRGLIFHELSPRTYPGRLAVQEACIRYRRFAK